MMNYFRRLKRKKGFTLTELIVVVALVALLMLSAALFAQPVRNMVSGTTAKSDTLTINEIIGNYLERRLSYADSIDVYAGVTYSTTTGLQLAKAFENYKSKYGNSLNADSSKKYETSTGMLVFHFENNNSEPYKSSYAIYDYPINKKDAAFTIPNIPTRNFNKPLSDSENDDYRDFQEKYALFKDEFYGGYQYFLTTDEAQFDINKLTHEAFFSLRIDAYNFDPYNSSSLMTSSDATGYYSYMKKKIEGTLTNADENPFDKLVFYRTAQENVSFAFQNIKPARGSDGIYMNTIESSRAHITRGNASGDFGTDVVIFYNVRKYSITDTV